MIQQALDFKVELARHLVIDDWQAVDILLAMVAVHKVKGEMLWLRLIGASGTGKTELLTSFSSLNDYCGKLESLTPASIRRGYVPDDDAKLPTLLQRIDGKLVITKELAPLLTANRELKLEVFGLLRSVHDGEIVADYGSRQGHICQQVAFDWILGSTRYIDRQSALDAQLGSRFIDLRWGAPLDRRAAVVKAIGNDGSLPAIRTTLANAMEAFINSVDPDTRLPKQDDNFLADIANFVSTFRTPIERDRQDKERVTDIPDPELGTRVGQAFARVVKGLSLIGIKDYKPYIRRLALDCLPPLRSACVKAIIAGRKTQSEVGDAMGVSQVTVHYVLEDLICLGFKREQLDLLKGGK